jgi:hypothetical protein
MDTQGPAVVAIDGLVNGVSLVFTMLRTYTSSKSGLSARKSESNSGDATISLRMVNKDTSLNLYNFIMHVHTLDVME